VRAWFGVSQIIAARKFASVNCCLRKNH